MSTHATYLLLASLLACGLRVSGQEALPHLFIDTASDTIVDEPKVDATLEVALSGEPTQAYDIGIEIRGKTSQFFEKKGFGFEIRDRNRDDLPTALLGLPAAADWVLHGPYADKSLIRNAFGYQTARAIGNPAPRSLFCELTVDSDYRGVYLLVERAESAARQLDLRPPPASDPDAGDYLVEVNWELLDEAEGWNAEIGYDEVFVGQPAAFQYKSPSAKNISPSQRAYIQSWFTDLDVLLSSPNLETPSDAYARYIDIDAWIDYVLLQELSQNVDAYLGSTYVVKRGGEGGGRLTAGPLWDMNTAYGGSKACGGGSAVGLRIVFQDVCDFHFGAPLMFFQVWRDPGFRQRAANRYFDLRRTEVFGEELFARIDSLERVLASAAPRNFARWPVLGEPIWLNAYVGETWSEELDYLRSWLRRRLGWLDGEMAQHAWEESDAPTPDRLRVGPHPIRAGALFRVELPAATSGRLLLRWLSMNGRPLPREGVESAYSALEPSTISATAPSSGGTYFLQVTDLASGEPLGTAVVVVQ